MPRKFDKEPVCCCVCKRAASGIAYAPRSGKPAVWMCDDVRCIRLGRAVFHMPAERLDVFERLSLMEAGEVAGGYLESVGKFSLDELSPEEWEKFLTTILTSYGDKMRARIESNAAPF